MNLGPGSPRGRVSFLTSGLLGPGSLASWLSAVGLLLVAVLSFGLLTGNFPGLGGPGASGGIGPGRTPTPSNVVIVDPRRNVPGTLAYAKAGNIWIQRAARAEQLTEGGGDSMPAFSPDGEWVYFVRTTPETGRWRVNGTARRYRLATPTLMRIATDGQADAEALLTGRLTFERPDLVVVHAPADHLARRHEGRAGDRRTRSHAQGRRSPGPRPRDPRSDRSWGPRGGTPRPPGSGLVARRPLPPVRQERARRVPRDARDHALRHHHRDSDRAHRPGLHDADVVTGWPLHRGDPDDGLRHRRGDPGCATRLGAPAPDDRRAELCPRLVAGRGCHRLPRDLQRASPTCGWRPSTPRAPPVAAGDRFPLTIAAGLAAGSRPAWWVPPELIPSPAPTATPAPAETTGASPAASAP